MPQEQPKAISRKEEAARLRRVERIAREMGFPGRVEYRHVACQTGGAQFGLATTPERDLLVVFAAAFDAMPAPTISRWKRSWPMKWDTKP